MKRILKRLINRKKRLFLRRTFNIFRGYYYTGKRYYCVCCNHSFSKFLSFGNIERYNAKCPRCESLERTRLLQYYLKNETDIFSKNKDILHFAPEYMLSKSLKTYSQNYISVDIEKGVADRVEDIQNLNFKNQTFDYLICSCVLGHVPNETKAIDEIYRVLKIGGRAFVLTVIDLNNINTFEDPNITSEDDKLKFYGEKDLLRLHGRDFINRLRRPIGTVKEIDYAVNFKQEDRNRFSLGNKQRELIFEMIRLN